MQALQPPPTPSLGQAPDAREGRADQLLLTYTSSALLQATLHAWHHRRSSALKQLVGRQVLK